MKTWISSFIKKMKRTLSCNHQWEIYDGNEFKRKCHKYNRVEWLFDYRYPLTGEPRYRWRFMYYVD